MNGETIGYKPIEFNKLPEIRQENNLLENLAPGKLPPELDFALSNIVICRMSK